MGRLDGKVAVITGATSGIGLRTAEIFIAEGAKIVIAGRRVPEGEALAKELGAHCIFRPTDVTEEDQMRALIALAVERFGKIDCLFNNAGGPARPAASRLSRSAASMRRWRRSCAASCSA
jgi:NAD(P)-dependent dehydrogenase (short-subunit alcohol dehydrogenase family)